MQLFHAKETPRGQSDPAGTHAPSEEAAAEEPAPARTRAKRKLPIRSSPVSAAPSLRGKLETLKAEAAQLLRRVSAAAKRNLPLFARKPAFQELEPRLLLSANLNPLAGDALLASPSTAPAEFRALTEEGKPSVVASAAVAPIHRTNELVFIDTTAPDYEPLVEDMRSKSAAEDRHLEFVLIDAWRDGVHKITEALTQRKDVDAIHIVSHARDGAVQLGSAQLDFDTLLRRATQIAAWGEALIANGDILFYGCDLAASQEGKSLLEGLSRLTGADVAASEGKTGDARTGGDWELEFCTGAEQREGDHLLTTNAPTFLLSVINGAAGGGPYAANVVFTGRASSDGAGGSGAAGG